MTTSDPSTDPDGWLQRTLREVCRIASYDPTDAHLIKFTNNAVFSLSTAPVVVRIPGSAPVSERVDKIVGVAQWLAAHDMPSVRLIDDLPQPIDVDGRVVTLWHEVAGEGQAPDGHDLGRILRRFHALPDPDFDLPKWEPIAGIRRRVDGEDILPAADHRFLEDQCDDLAEALDTLSYELPAGAIHGDSFIGNLIPSSHGPIICDFDSTANGPREWDLTPVAVGRQRFTYQTNFHQQLIDTYGTDVLGWPGFPTLRRLRELQLVTSVLPVLRTNTGLVDQWRHRFQTFRDGENDARWEPYV